MSRRRLRPVPGILPAALIGGAALTCGVALTATSGWLIVAASYRPQILTLLAAIVLVRAFGIARPALRYVERVRSHDAALAFLAEERARVFARLVPLTPARLGRRGRGDALAGVVDDLDDIAYAQVRVVVPLVALVLTALVAALADSVVLLPAAVVTLSAALWALVVGWIDYTIEAGAQPALVAARAQVAKVSAVVAARGGELRAIHAETVAAGWLADAQEQLRAALTRQAVGRAVGVAGMPLVTAVHTLAMVMVVHPWLAGIPMPRVAFLVLTPVALGEVVSGVPDALGALARAQGADDRLQELVTQRPAVRAARVSTAADLAAADLADRADEPGVDAGTDVPPLLRAEHVSATWDDRRAALKRLTSRIAPGTQLAVVGPNGSGKSTFLAVLARHLDPAAGRYTIDGADATTLPLAQARAHFAVVDDEPHVFASTLRENLRLARPGCTEADMIAALELAGLTDWYAGLPDGLDTPVGATGRGVSGGERARLGIARALLSERPVLLLDEPVAHLDHHTAEAVLEDVRRVSAGRTLVIVSHRDEGLAGMQDVLDLADPAPPPPLSGPR